MDEQGYRTLRARILEDPKVEDVAQFPSADVFFSADRGPVAVVSGKPGAWFVHEYSSRTQYAEYQYWEPASRTLGPFNYLETAWIVAAEFCGATIDTLLAISSELAGEDVAAPERRDYAE
jgi:hypothetical protein